MIYRGVSGICAFSLSWSHSGAIPGLGCIQWYAKQGRDGWDDNYLCAEVIGHAPIGMFSIQIFPCFYLDVDLFIELTLSPSLIYGL